MQSKMSAKIVILSASISLTIFSVKIRKQSAVHYSKAALRRYSSSQKGRNSPNKFLIIIMAQLEDYFDRQSDVPQEVTRCLRLIKELDEKVMDLSLKIVQYKLQKHYQNKPDEQLKSEIDDCHNEAIKLTSEKISVADKVYSIVDTAVQVYLSENLLQQLDNDLKKFEDTLKQSMVPDHKRRFLILSKYQKEKRKKLNQEIEQSKEIFQHAGQSEPIYCFCQKPSFGQMVMCDNQLCSREWFHLECVNLKDFPDENTPWYCSNDCKKEREGKGRSKK